MRRRRGRRGRHAPSRVPGSQLFFDPLPISESASQTSAALFGYLAWRQANKRRGLLWIAVLALLIFLVALSRVYLGVHFPSDVLAGWCASLAWVIGLALLFRHRASGARHGRPAT